VFGLAPDTARVTHSHKRTVPQVGFKRWEKGHLHMASIDTTIKVTPDLIEAINKASDYQSEFWEAIRELERALGDVELDGTDEIPSIDANDEDAAEQVKRWLESCVEGVEVSVEDDDEDEDEDDDENTCKCCGDPCRELGTYRLPLKDGRKIRHTKVTTGYCPICGHHGKDCKGRKSNA
jgi:hypothetical protein